ncbi:MAG: hypothetical protein WC373_04685 [Smithella sp.]|jgi:hypothetical protein
MKTNATFDELEKALVIVNKIYHGNVMFDRLDGASKNRRNFTLRVKDSSGQGARRGFAHQRMINACWHVHGNYFEALFKVNPAIWIATCGRRITNTSGNWIDRNIGSIARPLYYSEACDCQ